MPDVYVRPIEPLIAIILARLCGSPRYRCPPLGVSSLDLGRLWQRRRPFFAYAVTSAEQYEAERGSARARPGAPPSRSNSPLCTDWNKIKPGLRKCKYLHTGPSRGPPGSSRPQKDPDDRLRRATTAYVAFFVMKRGQRPSTIANRCTKRTRLWSHQAKKLFPNGERQKGELRGRA
jgi:hypothetical protein